MKKGGIREKTYSEERKKSRAESPEDPDAEIREEIRQTLEGKEIKEVIHKIGEWTSERVTAEKIFTIINIINEDAPDKALDVAMTLYKEESPQETVRAFWETVGIRMMKESEDFARGALNGILMPQVMTGGPAQEWMEGAMIAAMRHLSIAKSETIYKHAWGKYSWWGDAKEQAKKTVLEEIKTNRKFAERFLDNFRADEYEEYGEIISEAIKHYPAAEIFIEQVDRKRASSQIEEEEHEKVSSPWVDEHYEKAKALRKRVAQEALEHRDRIVEDRGGYTLSKEEFKEYFEPKTMQQGNVGNCYLVAAIYAMRGWPHAEVVLRKSVKRNLDGSWEVRFPFMDAEGEAVTITREEMQPQRNEGFGKERSGENRIDERETLNPLEGPEGYQALEAACIKEYFGEVDRAKSGEGGYSSSILKTFGGELFEREKFDSPIFNEKLADVLFKNFYPEIYIATCSCLGMSGGDEVRVNGEVITERGGSEPLEAEEKEIKIIKHHAYAVKSVDREEKKVRIVNPHNTAEALVISFEKFEEIFNEVEMVRINNERLLEEYKKADAAHDHEER